MENEFTLELATEQARIDIVNAINAIGNQYQLPAQILVLIVGEILSESKANIYKEAAMNLAKKIPDNAEPKDIDLGTIMPDIVRDVEDK